MSTLTNSDLGKYVAYKGLNYIILEERGNLALIGRPLPNDVITKLQVSFKNLTFLDVTPAQRCTKGTDVFLVTAKGLRIPLRFI